MQLSEEQMISSPNAEPQGLNSPRRRAGLISDVAGTMPDGMFCVVDVWGSEDAVEQSPQADADAGSEHDDVGDRSPFSARDATQHSGLTWRALPGGRAFSTSTKPTPSKDFLRDDQDTRLASRHGRRDAADQDRRRFKFTDYNNASYTTCRRPTSPRLPLAEAQRLLAIGCGTASKWEHSNAGPTIHDDHGIDQRAALIDTARRLQPPMRLGGSVATAWATPTTHRSTTTSSTSSPYPRIIGASTTRSKYCSRPQRIVRPGGTVARSSTATSRHSPSPTRSPHGEDDRGEADPTSSHSPTHVSSAACPRVAARCQGGAGRGTRAGSGPTSAAQRL